MERKKIITGLCVGVMACLLVACGKSAEEPIKPQQNTEAIENTEYVDYIGSEYEDEYQEFNVIAPELPLSSQKIDFTSPTGVHLQGTLVVSPLTKESFNPDTTLETLKNVESIKDWNFRYENYEQAYDYVDEQKLTCSFIRAESVIVEQTDEEGWPTGNKVIVDYNQNTAQVINYNSISVRFEESYDTPTLTEDDMHAILKVVYGEEIGTFLFEAEMGADFNEAYCFSELTGHGQIGYGRRIMEGYFDYDVTCCSSRDYITGYPGEEEMWTITPDVMYDFLGLPQDERNIMDRNNYGKTILEKYFGEGTRFPAGEFDFAFVGLSSHGFNMDEYQETKSFMINQTLNTPNAPEDETCGALWEEEYRNGEHHMSLLFSFDYKPAAAWTPEAKEDIRQKAMQITRDLLKIEDIDKYFTDGEFYEMEIGGKTEWVQVSFEWDDYYEEENATLFIRTSSDMSEKY